MTTLATIYELENLNTKKAELKEAILQLSSEISDCQRMNRDILKIRKNVSFDNNSRSMTVYTLDFRDFLQTQLQKVEAEINQLNQQALEEINSNAPIE